MPLTHADGLDLRGMDGEEQRPHRRRTVAVDEPADDQPDQQRRRDVEGNARRMKRARRQLAFARPRRIAAMTPKTSYDTGYSDPTYGRASTSTILRAAAG
jgi:hypothetical protein